MRVSGIYIIINIRNRKRYVGSAFNFEQRWKRHLSDLRKGVHHSYHLQSAYNIDGEDRFCFMIKEIIKDLTKLAIREQYWKDYYKSYLPEFGYDICPTVGSCLGRKHTMEAIAKMSKIAKILGKDPNVRMLRSELAKSQWSNPKVREKMVAGVVSKMYKTHSIESNNKVSEKAKERWSNPEFRAKMSEIHKAIWAKNGGYPGMMRVVVSKETKEKMALARKLWWDKRKASVA